MKLIYRLIKGLRLTAEEHDQNLTEIEESHLSNLVKITALQTATGTTTNDVSVIPISGLSYTVRADSYMIGGVEYSANPVNITLTNADALNSRIDIIIADTSGNIGKITGTPATNPTPPNYDPTTQFFIRFVLVQAGATTGSDIGGNELIVDYIYEDAVASGWTLDYNYQVAQMIAESTSEPINGAKSIKANNNPVSGYFYFSPTSEFDISNYDSLILTFKPDASFSTIFINMYNASGTKLRGSKAINYNEYGLTDFASDSTAKTILIPLVDFNLDHTFIDKITFGVYGSDWKFDDIGFAKLSTAPVNVLAKDVIFTPDEVTTSENVQDAIIEVRDGLKSEIDTVDGNRNLAGVSTGSDDVDKSEYLMTSGIPVAFKGDNGEIQLDNDGRLKLNQLAANIPETSSQIADFDLRRNFDWTEMSGTWSSSLGSNMIMHTGGNPMEVPSAGYKCRIQSTGEEFIITTILGSMALGSEDAKLISTFTNEILEVGLLSNEYLLNIEDIIKIGREGVRHFIEINGGSIFLDLIISDALVTRKVSEYGYVDTNIELNDGDAYRKTFQLASPTGETSHIAMEVSRDNYNTSYPDTYKMALRAYDSLNNPTSLGVLAGKAFVEGGGFEVEKGVKIGDDTDVASADIKGTFRYREDANNSYVDICMKTGVSSYVWENLKTKSW